MMKKYKVLKSIGGLTEGEITEFGASFRDDSPYLHNVRPEELVALGALEEIKEETQRPKFLIGEKVVFEDDGEVFETIRKIEKGKDKERNACFFYNDYYESFFRKPTDEEIARYYQ